MLHRRVLPSTPSALATVSIPGNASRFVAAPRVPHARHMSSACQAAAAASEPEDDVAATTARVMQEQPKRNIWQTIKYAFVGDKLDKERIASLGAGGFLAYGLISNLNYGTVFACAWLAFVKRNGLSPLAAGQWKPFLAFYAGFWAVQNFARPLRIALAVALAPAANRTITTVAQRLRIARGWSFGLLIFCMGVATSTALFSSLWLLGGFP